MLALILLCSGALGQTTPTLSFNFANFEGAESQFVMSGGTKVVGNSIQFSQYPQSPGARIAGMARYINPVMVNGFEISFTLYISDGNSTMGNGHEGFTFLIYTNAGGQGGYGPGLGYAPFDETDMSSGLKNSVAVEYDTFQSPGFQDPANDHISVHSMKKEANSALEYPSAAAPCQPFSTIINGAHNPDGQPFAYMARLRYEPPFGWEPEGTPGIFKAYEYGIVTPRYTCNAFTLSSDLDLMTGGLAYIAFTSSTGSIWDTQELQSWSYQYIGYVNANTSIANPPEGMAAGSTLRFKIFSRDQFGHAYPLGGYAQQFSVSASGATEVTVTDDNNGEYSVSLRLTSARATPVSVAMNGIAIKGSPFTVTVRPGPVDYTRSQAGSLSSGAAGAEQTFTVSTFDQFGNPLDTSNGNVGMSLTPSVSTGLQCTGQSGGTYSCTYTITQAAQYAATITLNSQSIGNSQQSFTIRPAAYHIPNTKYSGSGLEQGLAGEPNTFNVQLFDQYNNALTTGAATITATMTAPGSPPTVQNNQNGQYVVTYTAQIVQKYEVAVLFDNNPGQIFSIQLISNLPPDAGKSELAGPGLGPQFTVGVQSFVVVPKDQYGNVVGNRANITASFTLGGQHFPVTVQQLYDPTQSQFNVSYTITKSGAFALYVMVSNAGVPNNPFALNILPGFAVGSTSTASGDGLTSALSDEHRTFQVVTHDEYGNPCQDGLDVIVTCQITADNGNNGGISMDTVQNFKNGTFGCGYTIKDTGGYKVAITVQATPVQGSPFTLSVAWAKTTEVVLIVVGVVGGVTLIGLAILFWRIRRRKKDYVKL